MRVTHPPTRVASCPAEFDAEPYAKVSQSAYDLATVDPAGQHPTMSDQIASQGAALTRAQWDLLAALANPSWTPTYARQVLDDLVEHLVAVCPSCGTPIKVG